jgi:putative membrane protein
MTEEKKTSNELAQIRTRLASGRTLMAADRTLMAWLRTALSMISFGFTIYKVLQGFREGGAALPHPESPRQIGLFLIGLGTLAMIMGMIEYRGTIKNLQRIGRVRILRPSFFMAMLMSAMGLLLYLGISVRVL